MTIDEKILAEPDIAGKNVVNSSVWIQSTAMMLSYGLGMDDAAADVGHAVRQALERIGTLLTS